MERHFTSRTVIPSGLLLALVLPGSLHAQSSEVLTGTYTYAWMGADLGTACGQVEPGVLTRLRIGTVDFAANGEAFCWIEERVTCPGGAFEDWVGPVHATYVMDGDRLQLAMDPVLSGNSTWPFQMTWDREIGTLSFDRESDDGHPGIGVLFRRGTGLGPDDLLGDFDLVRLRQSQVEGGIEVRGSFGTLTFLPGQEYLQVVDQSTLGPSGSTLMSGMVRSGVYTLEPDGTLSVDDGVHVGAVTPDGSFGVLVRRSGFGSMLALIARVPTEEPTFWALDDLWWLGLYGLGRNEGSVPELRPYGESGVISFDAQSGRALVGHTEVWADEEGGGATNGFSFFPFSRTGPHTYALGEPDQPLRLRLGRHEDVLLMAEVTSAEDVWIGVAPRAWGPLVGDVQTVDPATGGVQTLSVRAGAALAGKRYLVLGSLTGTFPGMLVGGHLIPLDRDWYTHRTLTQPDPPLSGSTGTLDAAGAARAAFTVSAGDWTAVAGITVYHACVVLDPADPRTVLLASNAVPVVLGP